MIGRRADIVRGVKITGPRRILDGVANGGIGTNRSDIENRESGVGSVTRNLVPNHNMITVRMRPGAEKGSAGDERADGNAEREEEVASGNGMKSGYASILKAIGEPKARDSWRGCAKSRGKVNGDLASQGANDVLMRTGRWGIRRRIAKVGREDCGRQVKVRDREQAVKDAEARRGRDNRLN